MQTSRTRRHRRDRASRRLFAVVCIAIVVVAGILPGTAYIVCDALTPVAPLFALVVSVNAPVAQDEALPSSPFVVSLPPRAPPAV
jgi:peptidoglycan/LPS O-acetylase OafA/YrhL